MGNLNKVLLIGRLGQDPEKREISGGHSVINASLATTDYYKDQAGNRQERTEWHRIVLWNRLAEIMESYCRKGSQIFVEGTLQTREWQDKDGNRRFTTEIIVRNMQLLDSRSEPASAGGYQQSTQQTGGYQNSNSLSNSQKSAVSRASVENNDNEDDFVEDNIPF